MDDPCPICGEIDCGGVVYAYMVSEFRAGRNREHWRSIHDRADLGRVADLISEDPPGAGPGRGGCCG